MCLFLWVRVSGFWVRNICWGVSLGGLNALVWHTYLVQLTYHSEQNYTKPITTRTVVRNQSHVSWRSIPRHFIRSLRGENPHVRLLNRDNLLIRWVQQDNTGLLTVKQKCSSLGQHHFKPPSAEVQQILNLNVRRNEKKSIPNNNKGRKSQYRGTFICKNMHLIAFNSSQQLKMFKHCVFTLCAQTECEPEWQQPRTLKAPA